VYHRKDSDRASGRPTSRRNILKSGATLLGGAGTIAETLPGAAFAQGVGAPDAAAELSRLQASRRILLRGGVVLTLDPRIGDFARADVLIEGSKIREVRPSIEVSDDAAKVIDTTNQIIIPGFVDTQSHSYQGLLRNILTNGINDPDYNRDIQEKLTPAYRAEDAYAGVLVTALGFIDMGTTTIVDLSQVSHTPEHSDACISAL
jgi:hypothetical protein